MSLCAPESPRLRRLWDKIKFAFQLGPSEPLSAEDEALLRGIAGKIQSRRMVAPAILALQSMKPLNFIGSQALVGMQPFLELFISRADYERFTAIVERRDGYERLIELIEREESEDTHE